MSLCFTDYMSRVMIRPLQWHVFQVKTQISLGIRPVWSESSLCAQWVAKDPIFLHADSEDSDQTGRIPRRIWVFAGRTRHFVGIVMRWLTWDFANHTGFFCKPLVHCVCLLELFCYCKINDIHNTLTLFDSLQTNKHRKKMERNNVYFQSIASAYTKLKWK